MAAADAEFAGLGAEALAPRVAALKARQQGVFVELLEARRAIAGVSGGREPTESELEGDAWCAALLREGRAAAASLGAATRALERAQQADRVAKEAAEGDTPLKRLERQRTAAREASAADAAPRRRRRRRRRTSASCSSSSCSATR